MEWISVKDRLPERSGEYLVFTANGAYMALEYSEKHRAFNASDWLEDANKAISCTHWMPLPDVPEEG